MRPLVRALRNALADTSGRATAAVRAVARTPGGGRAAALAPVLVNPWAFAAGWTGTLVALVFYVDVSAALAAAFVPLVGFYVVDRIEAKRRTRRWTGTLADAEEGKS